MDRLLRRRHRAPPTALADDGGPDAAEAIMTTDSVAKQVARAARRAGRSAAWPRAPACSRPALATMLVVLTTDAVADAGTLDAALRAATARDLRPDRLRRLHVHQRHRAAAGQRRLGRHARTRPSCRAAVTAVCADLARQLHRRRRGRQQGHRDRRRGRRAPRTTRSRSPGRSPATTCSSARSTARTRTGAGSWPRSARPTALFEPDACRRGASTASGSAATGPPATTASRSTCPAARSRSPSTCAPAPQAATVLDQRPDRRPTCTRTRRTPHDRDRAARTATRWPRPASWPRRCPGSSGSTAPPSWSSTAATR